jgi:hypothetical protein
VGHVRVGRLPKTKPWAGLFHQLQGTGVNAGQIAQATAKAAQEHFAALEGDRRINYCFWFLARLVTAARSDDFTGELARLGLTNPSFTSGLAFVQQVSRTVEREQRKRGQPTVFSRMAELSLRQVLSANLVQQSQTLFGTGQGEIQAACRAISTRQQFGRVARDFFAAFMSRTIRYVTDKELSNYVGPTGAMASPTQVLEFEQALNRHCQETAKIVEEFAGGWFSKHNWEANNDISERETAGFTAYALQKIQMDLREGEA